MDDAEETLRGQDETFRVCVCVVLVDWSKGGGEAAHLITFRPHDYFSGATGLLQMSGIKKI